MDDSEAERQIQQMVNFILNEAKETAGNITSKANEDFNIEKLKLVQQMKDKIRTDMLKRKKQEETKKAIDRSTAINRARLKKIEARQSCIERLNTDVADQLKQVAKVEGKYKQIIVDLIVQGALKLMEEELVVKCRQEDLRLVSASLDAASAQFTKTLQSVSSAKMSVKLTMDKDFLPTNCLGGVILSCRNGSITVDNTLATRLKLVMENDRPSLRKMLFPVGK